MIHSPSTHHSMENPSSRDPLLRAANMSGMLWKLDFGISEWLHRGLVHGDSSVGYPFFPGLELFNPGVHGAIEQRDRPGFEAGMYSCLDTGCSDVGIVDTGPDSRASVEDVEITYVTLMVHSGFT
jgi:hypothetical protein